MIRNSMGDVVAFAPALLMVFLFTSCFTGIEGTKTITLSKEEVKNTRPTEEEMYFADIVPTPLIEWHHGRRFYVTDNRASLVLAPKGELEIDSLAGAVLEYDGMTVRTMPDGKDVVLLNFNIEGTHGADRRQYITGMSPDKAASQFDATMLPMSIDLELVETINNRLKGKTLWTRKALWYDENMQKVNGLKFVPVTIDSVLPGNMVFPLKVAFTDADGRHCFMQMNTGRDGNDSRTFATLFYLKDNRQKYNHISDEVWSLIRQSRVARGMTKEECKLAIGLPLDVSTGHDYSQAYELWQYSDGRWLQFRDGILSEFGY